MFYSVHSIKSSIQGAPIKNNPLFIINPFIISVSVTDFFIKFTAFTEGDSHHIRQKFRHNGLKTSSSAMAEGPRDALVSRNSATTKYPYRMALFA